MLIIFPTKKLPHFSPDWDKAWLLMRGGSCLEYIQQLISAQEIEYAIYLPRLLCYMVGRQSERSDPVSSTLSEAWHKFLLESAKLAVPGTALRNARVWWDYRSWWHNLAHSIVVGSLLLLRKQIFGFFRTVRTHKDGKWGTFDVNWACR